MQDHGESAAIVHINQRLNPFSQPGAELLNAVSRITSKHLRTCLGHLFEQIDDALFNMADKAENHKTQMHYFDSMREIRKRRLLIERHFLTQVAHGLKHFVNKKNLLHLTPKPANDAYPAKLERVADNDLEESLAISGMIVKTNTRLTQVLFAIQQRLSVIFGGIKINDANNPVGPAVLIHIFHRSVREINTDMPVKLIIYKMFDRHVLQTLNRFYKKINTTLVLAGVLPELDHPMKHSERVAGHTRNNASTQHDDIRKQLEDELFQVLRSLLQIRRISAHQAVPATHQEPPLKVHELFGALSVMQDKEEQITGSNMASLNDELQQLKEQLLSHINTVKNHPSARVSTLDEDIMDLIGMLFEFIVQDSNLPLQMRALLVGLQIPYLKAALLNHQLFVDRRHSARRLLNNLGELAMIWSPQSDRDGRLMDTMKSVIYQLLEKFDGDMNIFDRLCKQISHFRDSVNKCARPSEQHVTSSTRSRAKIEQARHRATQEVISRTRGHELSPLIHTILSRPWTNYLVLNILRQGEESTNYSDALNFIDDFVLSAQAVHTNEEKHALRQRMVGIERMLRRGLTNVGLQPKDIESILAQLHQYYQEQLSPCTGGTARPAAPTTLHDDIPESVKEKEALTITNPEAGALSPLVRQLHPGIWLEFTKEPDSYERARLAWINPTSHHYLFVNRLGLKVCNYSVQELSNLFTSKKARILDTTLLFDRAMKVIFQRLNQNTYHHQVDIS